MDAANTLLLSTYSLEQGAEISYAPYVREKLTFFIYVSELARHTANMQTASQASVMFIQPEGECSNLFARQRVIFNCRVHEISRSDRLYERQLQAMRNKFGETVELLRSLKGFHLMQLQAQQGQYIAGFGRTYAIDIENLALLYDMG